MRTLKNQSRNESFDVNSPLTKPTSNDQEGNTHCLMAQFPWQKSCAWFKWVLYTAWRKEGVVLMLWPGGIRWSILACTLCTKGCKLQRGEKTQHERFWLNLFLWHSAWTDAFPGDGSWGAGGTGLKQALGNQRLSFFLVHFEQSFQTWGNYPLMFTSACSSSFGNDPTKETWASYVLIQSHINDWARERQHTTNATKCNCSGWDEQNVAL